jgi:diguanylate cyclase (GGDEF) domain
MPNDIAAKLHRLRDALTGPQTLAFLPALCLGAFWFGGESLLIACALLVPALATLLGMSDATRHHRPITRDGLTGLPLRRTVTDILDQILDARDTTGRTTACLVIEIDDFHALSSGLGATASDDILISAAQRLRDALRDHDTLARLEGARFAIVFAPVRRADLESLIQLASRLQAALSEPFSINASKIFATASIGFCLPNRAPAASGQAFLDAAEIALSDAHRNGPGSIRAYSPAIAARIPERSSLNADVGDALENGQILPWFQPQISTDTGTVSGMEALARWVHPEQGALPPLSSCPISRNLACRNVSVR